MTKFPDPESTELHSNLEIFNPSGHDLPFQESSIASILKHIEEKESVQFHSVELVFTDETGIIDINSEYLNREYVTDIISFRLDDDSSNQSIEGTLYCCAPRIAEQSEEFDSTPKTEFLRIIVHGLLHLVGYNDQSDTDKEKMTSLEDHYLQILSP
jgi:rRNA maturation RNase YbeY